MADRYNINITRGDTYAKPIYFVDEETKTPKDITGWIVRFTAKRNISDADVDAIIQKNITVHIDPSQGNTQLSLSEDDTDQDIGVPFWYDLEYETNTGDKKTFLEGIIQFSKDVTQRST